MTTTTERARAILVLPEAQADPDYAAHLAHDTAMSVDEARGMLQGRAGALDAMGRPATGAEAYGHMVATQRENAAQAKREADTWQAEQDAGAAAARQALGLK